jgi:hypothetical protein
MAVYGQIGQRLGRCRGPRHFQGESVLKTVAQTANIKIFEDPLPASVIASIAGRKLCQQLSCQRPGISGLHNSACVTHQKTAISYIGDYTGAGTSEPLTNGIREAFTQRCGTQDIEGVIDRSHVAAWLDPQHFVFHLQFPAQCLQAGSQAGRPSPHARKSHIRSSIRYQSGRTKKPLVILHSINSSNDTYELLVGANVPFAAKFSTLHRIRVEQIRIDPVGNANRLRSRISTFDSMFETTTRIEYDSV